MLLIVTKPGEQFLARRMVNAFTDYWYQRYAAEREMELEALSERKLPWPGADKDQATPGPGQVLEAEADTSRRETRSRMKSTPREGMGQSW